MPIEFACESCTKLLRVPDGTGGRSCECPACGKLLEIPDPNAIEVVEVVDGSESKEAVAVACPKCRQTLVCPTGLLGTKGQCRNCKYIFLISTDPQASGSAAEAEDGGVVFSCPKCDQLFDGKEEMRGRKGKCHVCGEVFQIELKPAERRETVVLSRSEVEAAQKDKQRRRPAAATPQTLPTQTRVESDRSAPIQIVCPKCQGVMEVPGAAAGQSTACPFCEQLLQIPATPRRPTPAARLPQSATGQNARQPVPQSTSQENMWAELGDLSGATEQLANPYQPPAAVLPPSGESAWAAPRAAKQFRGLTFSNAFGLLFDTAFPWCLAAPVLLGTLSLICFLFIMVGGFSGGFLVSLVKPQSETSAYALIFTPIIVAALISICFATAGICMTCNTALHAVRRKRITASVIFGTGDSYGGVLVLVLMWTLLNAFHRFGTPWLVSSYIESGGQRETAAVIAISLIGLVFLLQMAMFFLFSTAPFAMLDGDSLPDALQESAGILFSNFFTVTGVIICGSLLYLLISIVSCGLGAILLIGMQVYLMAAVYHLADK